MTARSPLLALRGKELEKLPLREGERILARLEKLTAEPRPAQALKLQGNRGLWRVRMDAIA